MTTPPEAPTPTSLSIQALAELHTVLDRVIEIAGDPLTGLAAEDHHIQTMFLRGFEEARNRMGLVDSHILAAADQTVLSDHHQKRTSGDTIRALLNLDPHTTQARVRAEKYATAHQSMTGETIPARFGHIAAAQQSGVATPAQIDRLIAIMLRLAKVEAFTPEQLVTAEQILVSNVDVLDPAGLSQLADQIRARIDPDGDTPDDDWNDATRRANWGTNPDGTLWFTGRFTTEAGAAITTVLDSLSRRNDSPDTPDTRSAEQRRHDAVETVFTHALNSDGLPATGGTPATVIITMTEDHARTGRGTALLDDGRSVSVSTAFRLADQANIAAVSFSPTGAILNLGRKCRIASTNQTIALYARDRGCSFPGCTVPPKWTQRHHIKPWQSSGPTDLTNLTLVCHFHHHNFERLGWVCEMRDGLPWWIPPPDKDPDQTPRLHQRLHPTGNLDPLGSPPTQRT